MKEIWAQVEGYDGAYEVSTNGRIRTYRKRNRYSPGLKNKPSIMRLYKNKKGRHYVVLFKDNKYKRFTVYRLVAKAFLPNPNNYQEVNHKDENPSNDRLENLEWCTRKYNLHYSHVCEKMKAAAVKKQQKAVLMYDKEGNFVREYESITIAAQAIGNFQQNVSKCCYGQAKTVSGYIFKFK